jgi:hypothetical protein
VIAVRKLISFRHQLNGHLSRGLESMFASEKIIWQIETIANSSDQVAALRNFSEDPPVTFSSSGRLCDLSSRLNYAHWDRRLH